MLDHDCHQYYYYTTTTSTTSTLRLVLQRLLFPLLLLLFSISTTHCCYYASFCCCLLFPFAASVCGTAFPSHHRQNHTPILHFLAVNHISTAGSSTFFSSLLSSSVVIFQPIICILHTASRYDSMGLRLLGTARRWYCSRNAPSQSLDLPSILPSFPPLQLTSPSTTAIPSTIHHPSPLTIYHLPPAHTFTTS